jgi:hypothetical protein
MNGSVLRHMSPLALTSQTSLGVLACMSTRVSMCVYGETASRPTYSTSPLLGSLLYDEAVPLFLHLKSALLILTHLQLSMAVNTFPKSPIGQKKALLIGIKYEESGEAGLLEGPHEGVTALRKILIGEFQHLDFWTSRFTLYIFQNSMDMPIGTL